MLKNNVLVLGGLFVSAYAQSQTLSGCHFHESQEYCYLPNGSEIPITRASTSTSSIPRITTSAPNPVAASETAGAVPAEVTACHDHGTEQFCMGGETEYQIVNPPSITPLPTAYTKCHSHDDGMFCFGPDGGEVSVAPSGAAAAVATTNARPTGEPARRERNCHFHAGVEHCEDDEQGSEGKSCDSAIRDYNRPLRIGLLFVVLFGTGLAVFTPILLEKFTRIDLNGIVFIILKQFGTGVIISTAYVHLLTHAQLMFSNECLGALGYEATATAIVMAGIFLAFCFEYFGKYLDRSHAEKSASLVDSEHNVSQISESLPQSDESKQTNTTLAGLGHMHSHPGSNPDTQFNVLILEAGIVFHSILIGLTLVVAGDSFFRTLFVVVLFHQMFEGIALGTRIAALRVNLLPKMLMAGLFAIITPVGMAIGIGVLKRFNGNSPPTIVAIGTLNALSAGILVWVGLVEMWSRDWLHGDMAKASPPHVLIGITSLMLGMGIMSVLGKWA